LRYSRCHPRFGEPVVGYLSHPYDPTVTVSLSGGTVAGSGISVDVFIGATGTPVAGVLNFSANVVPGAGAEYGGGDATSYVQPVTDVVFSIIGVGTGVNLLERDSAKRGILGDSARIRFDDGFLAGAFRYVRRDGPGERRFPIIMITTGYANVLTFGAGTFGIVRGPSGTWTIQRDRRPRTGDGNDVARGGGGDGTLLFGVAAAHPGPLPDVAPHRIRFTFNGRPHGWPLFLKMMALVRRPIKNLF